MSLHFKKPPAFVAASMFIVCTAFILLWLRDVQNDRKHTVNVNGATPVFAGDGSDWLTLLDK